MDATPALFLLFTLNNLLAVSQYKNFREHNPDWGDDNSSQILEKFSATYELPYFTLWHKYKSHWF
jgi:hypothetical protein